MSKRTAFILIINGQTTDNIFVSDLKKLGHVVVAVDNIQQGLQVISKINPHLILLALDGSPGNWSQALSVLSREAPDIPVVTMGYEITPYDAELSFQLGAFNFLELSRTSSDTLKYVADLTIMEAVRRQRSRGSQLSMNAPLHEPEGSKSCLKKEVNLLKQQLAVEKSKRAYAEKMARSDRERLKVIFENTNDAIIELDSQGVIKKINKRVLDIFRTSPHNILGKNICAYNWLGEDYLHVIKRHRTSSEELPLSVSTRELLNKDGKKIYIEFQTKTILSDNDSKGVMNIINDITPQKKLEKIRNATMLGLAKLAESRDGTTGRHLERIREYVKLITQTLGKLPQYTTYITPAYINDIYHSAILHDIGKVGIPDAILLKRGQLTKKEFEIIKQHTIVGGKALTAMDAELQEQSFLTLGKEIAYYHHESWDGSGYPDGLKGEDIPLSARIVALADVYDALTSERTYKNAYSHEKAVTLILEERGKKFDPEIVDAFEANLDQFDKIRCETNDSALLRNTA